MQFGQLQMREPEGAYFAAWHSVDVLPFIVFFSVLEFGCIVEISIFIQSPYLPLGAIGEVGFRIDATGITVDVNLGILAVDATRGGMPPRLQIDGCYPREEISVAVKKLHAVKVLIMLFRAVFLFFGSHLHCPFFVFVVAGAFPPLSANSIP